jgi:ESCRT-I complex subunit TSG101
MVANLLARTNAYRDKARVQRDATATMNSITSLKANLGLFGLQGPAQNLLYLVGTIPIYYKGVQYNIPVNIWFTANYPLSPPTMLVIPAIGMELKPQHKHVDSKGIVYLPYLNQWNAQSSSINELVTFASSVFSANPPVFASNRKKTAQPVYRSGQHQANMFKQPVPNSSYQQQQQTPVSRQPFVTQPVVHNNQNNFHNNNNNNNQAQIRPNPVQNNHTASDPRALKKQRLVAQITSKLQDKYTSFNNTHIAELDKLFDTQNKLQDGAGQVKKLVTSLEHEAKVLSEVTVQFTEKNAALEAWISKNETKSEAINVEDVVQYNDTWSEQLFHEVSEDHAIEDTLYCLDRLLADDIITLKEFLKVR